MRSNKLPRPLREFLSEHEISTRLVFDASGFSKPERVSRMKARGKLYFVNGPKHSRCGLCLKDRSGHCIMCHPEAIKHQRDYAKPGYVYVARSPSSKLIKVGVAPGGREGRERSLNATRYGNCSDWKM